MGEEEKRGEVATPDEVLGALTRVLRGEEKQQTLVKVKRREPEDCGDGRVRYREYEDVKVLDVPPRVSDLNRAAELLGKRYALYKDAVRMEVELPRIVDDIGPEESDG